MSTKLDLGKVFFVILLLVFSTMTALAGTIRGTVTDKQTGEPLTGATVQVVGTTQGVIADLDGNFTIEVANGTYTLQIRYVGYKDVELASIKVGSEPVVLNIAMESDAQALGEVSVTARKNLEGERALQLERKQASLAIENLGAKEMSIKGISNVQEGVKQITGISIADAGQPAERTAHRLTQPGQQTDSARPFPIEHRTEYHRQQGLQRQCLCRLQRRAHRHQHQREHDG